MEASDASPVTTQPPSPVRASKQSTSTSKTSSTKVPYHSTLCLHTIALHNTSPTSVLRTDRASSSTDGSLVPLCPWPLLQPAKISIPRIEFRYMLLKGKLSYTLPLSPVSVSFEGYFLSSQVVDMLQHCLASLLLPRTGMRWQGVHLVRISTRCHCLPLPLRKCSSLWLQTLDVPWHISNKQNLVGLRASQRMHGVQPFIIRAMPFTT